MRKVNQHPPLYIIHEEEVINQLLTAGQRSDTAEVINEDL
jgi:hypothetical protein